MTLLVRDEADVVRANLDHHLEQGVDLVIATDNGSVDGTVAVLEEYRDAGVLELIHEPADDYAQARWVTRMARRAAELGADWVIHADADEFFLARHGTVREALAAVDAEHGERVGVLAAQRHDLATRPEDGRPFFERMVYRKAVSTNVLGKRLPPKVIHRADPTAEVAQGNHSVSGQALGEVLDDGRIEILHCPQRTYAQMENKVVKGGAAYERNTELPSSAGNTWRWLYAEQRAGRLPDWWATQVVDDDELERALADGELVEDRRLERALHRLGHGTPVRGGRA